MLSAALRANPYGWVIVALSFFALVVVFSTRASLGLLMPVWETDPGWSRAAVSSGGALVLLAMGIASPLSGNLVDRIGPRAVYTGGLFAIAAGVWITAQGSSYTTFLIGFCMAAGAGFGTVTMSVASATVARYFVGFRGLATGLTLAGSTCGLLIMMPLLAVAVETLGWRTAYRAIGVAALAIAFLAWFLLRRSPAPDRTGPARGGNGHAVADRIVPEGFLPRIGFLFRDRTFLLLTAGFTLCGFTTAGVFEVHMLPYAALCGFVPVEGATAYGITGAFNMAGLIFFGWAADRTNRPRLLAGMYFTRAASFILLLNITDNLPLFFFFAALFGLLNFATLPVLASIVATHIGVRVMGLTLGLAYGFHSLGAAVGAYYGGVIFDLFARYEWLWYTALGLAVMAGFITLLIEDKPRRLDAPALA